VVVLVIMLVIYLFIYLKSTTNCWKYTKMHIIHVLRIVVIVSVSLCLFVFYCLLPA